MSGARPDLSLVGRWLTEFQRVPITADRTFSLDGESRTLARWSVELDPVGLGHRHRAAAADWADRDPGYETRDLGIIHKDLHPAHLFVDDQRCSVIDLDEVRIGPGAFDAGHFIANLRLLARRIGHRHRAQRWIAEFTDGYRSAGGSALERDLRRSEVYALLKITWQVATNRGPLPRPIGEAGIGEARWALTRAERLLRGAC